MDDAATYLLAALASKAGDGRRRTLEELISVIRVTCSLDNSHKLSAAIKTAKTIQLLITPPGEWTARETFFVPSRDLLQAFAQLNAHRVLDSAICSVAMDQPLALEASVRLCEPLETIIRKGMPLVKQAKGGETPVTATVEGKNNKKSGLVGEERGEGEEVDGDGGNGAGEGQGEGGSVPAEMKGTLNSVVHSPMTVHRKEMERKEVSASSSSASHRDISHRDIDVASPTRSGTLRLHQEYK